MLKGRQVLIKIWEEAVNTVCYTLNQVYLYPRITKTPCELWKGNKPNLKHFYEFGCTCYILNDMGQIGKLNAKGDEGIFLVYSLRS